jgi:hypothetical protein
LGQEQSETLLLLSLPYLSKALNANSVTEKYDLLKEHLMPSFGTAPCFLTDALVVEPYDVFYGHAARWRRRLWFEGNEEGKPNAGWV